MEWGRERKGEGERDRKGERERGERRRGREYKAKGLM